MVAREKVGTEDSGVSAGRWKKRVEGQDIYQAGTQKQSPSGNQNHNLISPDLKFGVRIAQRKPRKLSLVRNLMPERGKRRSILDAGYWISGNRNLNLRILAARVPEVARRAPVINSPALAKQGLG